MKNGTTKETILAKLMLRRPLAEKLCKKLRTQMEEQKKNEPDKPDSVIRMHEIGKYADSHGPSPDGNLWKLTFFNDENVSKEDARSLAIIYSFGLHDCELGDMCERGMPEGVDYQEILEHDIILSAEEVDGWDSGDVDNACDTNGYMYWFFWKAESVCLERLEAGIRHLDFVTEAVRKGKHVWDGIRPDVA